jgi:hypothetical protein
VPNFYIVPGVYPIEIDLTASANPAALTTGAFVFAARRGTLSDYFETDTNHFTTNYGNPDYTWCFTYPMITAFLQNGDGAWLSRVVNDAEFAGSVVSNDVEGVRATSTHFWPFPDGRTDDYTVGGQEYQSFTLSAPLITGNSIAVSLTSDIPTGPTVFTQAFTTDSNTTLGLLATQINTALSTAPFLLSGVNESGDAFAPGAASVIPVGSATNDQRTIQILNPEGTLLTVNSVVVTAGASQATAVISINNWLFEVWAQNPGVWANRVGYKILNVDNGVNQRLELTFSAAITSGGVFNANIFVNGVAVVFPTISFTTDMPTTAQNIVNEFLSVLGPTADGWVVAGSNGLEIVIVSPIDGPSTLQITNPIVTGGGAPTIAVSEILSGILNDGTFQLFVYTRDNINAPIEQYTVAFVQQLDGNGVQQFIETAINSSANASNYIRIRYNHLNEAGQLLGIPPNGTPIQWLAGGTDGMLPTNAQIAARWESSYVSRRTRPVNLLINGGYSSPVVQQEMDSLAQRRFDCFSIIDMPSDSQATGTIALNYRANILNINSNYSAIYTPDLLITDPITNTPLYIPPSGHVASQFAYNDKHGAVWTSPAGLNRALILNVTGLRVDYNDDDLAILIGGNINPIIRVPSQGYSIKSAETLQNKKSAFSQINVRRLVTYIEIALVDGLDYYIYEPNTTFTQFLIAQLCVAFLMPIKTANPPGLYDFAVVCDSRTTTTFDIDMDQANVDLFLKPVLPIKFIQLTSVITKTGAFFQEIISAITGGTSGIPA